MPAGSPASFLNESEQPTRRHYLILAMCWAGWLFDFYDLMLFSFLLVPIQQSLGLGETSLSLLLGASLAATALGGILFGYLADRFGRRSVLSWTILVYSARHVPVRHRRAASRRCSPSVSSPGSVSAGSGPPVRPSSARPSLRGCERATPR